MEGLQDIANKNTEYPFMEKYLAVYTKGGHTYGQVTKQLLLISITNKNKPLCSS